MTVLRVADVQGAWSAVRLITDLWKREPPRALTQDGAYWELELGDLPVDRLEYELEVERADGTTERICAPGETMIPQPFGAKSVLELPGYRAPAWLASDAPRGRLEVLRLSTEGSEEPTTGLRWTAPGLAPDAPAPLLVALDGPEYVRFAALDQFLAFAVSSGLLPPLRAALLAPRARDDDYSGSDAFADSLARELIPQIEQPAATQRRIGLGASLGGLALLHAHVRHPSLFDALVLQSGSFFDEQLDGQESHYRSFPRIAAFVREVAAPRDVRRIPIAITCGTGEENLANNRALAQTLAAQGYPVSVHERRDGHTWTCWRDVFEPAFASIA